MNRLAPLFRNLLRTAMGVGAVAVVLVLLFIAWWIAALAVTGLVAYAGVRRLLGGRKAAAGPHEGSAVIEGEYRVEADALPDSRSRRDP